MSTERIHIDLTDEQRTQIKQESGHDAQAIEFDLEELEQRIAPVSFNYGSLEIKYYPQNS